MKNATLIVALLLSVVISNAQSSKSASKTEKSPAMMMGLDSTLIKMEYTRFNNFSDVEYWQQIITPDRLIYYCVKSDDKNQVNVAHVYEFDENGINNKYTTVAADEKARYACDYFNNLALNYKYVYDYKGMNDNNQHVWVSSKNIKNQSDCGCGNLVVTVTSSIPQDEATSFLGNIPVKPGKSGELMTIVYVPEN